MAADVLTRINLIFRINVLYKYIHYIHIIQYMYYIISAISESTRGYRILLYGSPHDSNDSRLFPLDANVFVFIVL